MTTLEQQFNKQIQDEMLKENYQLAAKGYIHAVYHLCIDQCYQKGARLTQAEKKCLMNCYRNETVSLNSHINAVVHSLKHSF